MDSRRKWKDLLSAQALKPNDKPKLNPKSQTMNAPGRESSPDSTKDDDLDFDGEFADEESLAMLKAVRARINTNRADRR